jgi:hypothetical protein
MEEDFPFLRKQDADGWEIWLTDLLTTTLGKVAAADVLVTLGTSTGIPSRASTSGQPPGRSSQLAGRAARNARRSSSEPTTRPCAARKQDCA